MPALYQNAKAFNILPGIVFIAVILYVIAWNVTDVRLDRLVERFNDARTVATNLLNPDVITISINGQDQICAWKCMFTYVNDKLARHPAQGPIRWSDNLLDYCWNDQGNSCASMGNEIGLGSTWKQSKNIFCWNDASDHRHGIDGDDLLNHLSYTGQLFGGTQYHVAGTRRNDYLLSGSRHS